MSRNVLKGVSFDGTHSYNDLGLFMAEYPQIDMPTVQDSWVKVPGRDGLLNLTTGLDGYTHYYNRDCEFNFLCVGSKQDGMAAYSRLANLLHGQRVSRVIFDEDAGYFYTGQFEVSGIQYKDYRSTITVKGDLDPFKYEMYSSRESWQWDALNFENGYIRDTDEYLFGVKDLTFKTYGYNVFTIPCNEQAQILQLYVNLKYTDDDGTTTTGSSISVYVGKGKYSDWSSRPAETDFTTYTGAGYVTVPAIMLDKDSNVVTVCAYGTGTVYINYRGQSL